eukprot:403355562
MKGYKENVYAIAHETAKREGLYKEREFKERKEFRSNYKEYAMLKLAMYDCFKCFKIFCGGRRDCEAELNVENQPKKEDILCVYCQSQKQGVRLIPCKDHGELYIEHKCQFCCDTATFFCWGATRFCDPCHQIGTNCIPKICNPETCQFKGKHPPNGKPYSFGCKMCRINEEEKKIEEDFKIFEKKKEIMCRLLKRRFAILELKKRKNEQSLIDFNKRELSDEQNVNQGSDDAILKQL